MASIWESCTELDTLYNMRSVFVFLVRTTMDAVRSRLADFADGDGDRWWFPPNSKDHTLEIGFYLDFDLEFEPEDREALQASLGQLPDVIVTANISGRIPGDTETRQFVTFMLRNFQGVAWDDYTPHCWTLAEIESDHKVSGHPFFDYKGWYQEGDGA